MYSPGDKEQVLPAPETSLLPWPVHKTSKSAVLANDWERFPHPKELQYLPDVEQTPYELRQIIKRSLYEYEPTSSSSPLSKAEIPDPEAQAALTPTMLPDGPEKQTRESVGSVHSEETCHGGDEAPAAAAVSGTTFVPSSLDAHIPKPRELKSKSSFLSAKIERLGAKIEKLELVASRRSSRSAEQPKVVVTVECASCLEDVPKSDVTSLSCTHTYCGPCFTTLVTTAMQTESLFPPKCCLTEIPLKTVLYALDDQQRSSYKQKAAEWAQPMEKRWYCPEPTCAKWITPSKLHRSWTTGLACPHCQTSICRTCRGLAHAKDTPCPQDFGLNAMLDIAEREGWRRCYQCKVLVEKTSGCRHMTCTCKAQFCYTCGSKWKTCGCTEVDQARREEELRERRMAVDAEARWEGEAIARAIAEVEAAERREAQEREAAERRREDERRREEEELRRLEELRLAEEEQRRRDEEDAERKRIETINSSIEERTSSLAKMLTELVQIQQMALISRHDNTMQTVRTASEARRASRQEDYDRQKQKLLTNIENRSRRMKQKHDTEMTTTRARHESEEDAMFMQVQMHLHGKPNQKAREKAIMDSLRQSHKDELARLARTQTEEAADLREVAEVEARSLGYGHWAHLEKIKNGTELKMVDLDRQVMAERHWFEGVARRRHALLEDLRNDLLRTMGESHLLDEWEALPFPPAVPRFSFSEDGPDLLNQSTPTPDSSLTPQSSSPGTPEEVPAVPVTADPSSSVLPCTKPAKPSLFISTVMAESHTASEESSQSVWETQSHRAGQSGTASTTSRLSVHLQRRGGVKADKVSRWSFLSSSKKEQVDDETWKGDVRRTVAGVF